MSTLIGKGPPKKARGQPKKKAASSGSYSITGIQQKRDSKATKQSSGSESTQKRKVLKKTFRKKNGERGEAVMKSAGKGEAVKKSAGKGETMKKSGESSKAATRGREVQKPVEKEGVQKRGKPKVCFILNVLYKLLVYYYIILISHLKRLAY